MFVFSNLAISLDGKIATPSRSFFPLGTPEDRKQMLVLRRECDSLIMGASTLRTYRKPCTAGSGQKKHPVNVIVSSSLQGISPRWPFFTSTQIQRILFVSEKAPRKKIAEFEKSAEIIRMERPTARKSVATQILRALEARDFRRLLVEGGGGLMWDFVSQNLIDEYHVTLTPRLIGGTESPTLVDGHGLDPRRVVNLKLVQCRQIGDELYLIYRKTGKRGP